MSQKKKFEVVLQLTTTEQRYVWDMESIIADYIIKYLVLALNFFPFPHRIHYNPINRRFLLFPSSWLRKVICIVWQGIIVIRLAMKCTPNSLDTSDGILSPIIKAMYVVFTFYCCVYFGVFWRKAQTLTGIMNQVMDLSSLLTLKLVPPPKTYLIRNATYASLGYSVIFAFISHIFLGILRIMDELRRKQMFPAFLLNKENETLRLSLQEKVDPGSFVVIQFLKIIANFLNTFNWMMSYLYIGLWALAFRQLLLLFFWRIHAMNENNYVVNLPNEIRTFNVIGSLIDQWNDVMGFLLLGGAAAGIMYFSMSVEELVRGIKNVTSFGVASHLMISYIPILAGVLMVAEVHRMAVNIGGMIKDEFGKWKGNNSSDRYMTEALQGMCIVHHDIVMNNVGFKGLGFFTISYQYVLTMVSVVITYALVAVQWFPEINKKEMNLTT